MKKNLMISYDSDNYVVKIDDDHKFLVPTATLILNGTDLFNALFSDVSLKEPLQYDIDISDEISGSHEKRVAEDIKTVINNIVVKINDEISNKSKLEDSDLKSK